MLIGLSFKDLYQTYFQKISTSRNKYLTPQFLKEKDPTSFKSTVRMSSLNLAYTFPLLNFIITGFFSSKL